MNKCRIFAICVAVAGLSVAPSSARAQPAPEALHVVTVASEGPLLVVLHGGPGMRHNYLRPEWDRLGQVATVVYYDQRGCGLSTRVGPFSWQQHVADLDGVLRSMAPEGKVFVAGSSWGAMLALLYAHFHPERVDGLILSGMPSWTQLVEVQRASYLDQPRPRQMMLENIGRIANYPPERLAGMELDSAAVANPPGAPEGADLTLSRRLGTVCRLPLQVALVSLFNAPPLGAMGDLQVPVLVVDGSEPDPRGSGAAEVAAALPNARLNVVDGAGHDPWLEQPEKFFPLVVQFMQGPR